MNKTINFKDLILLNCLFLIYAATGMLSKKASSYEYFSLNFIEYFGLAILAMALYAIGWQLMLKKVPISLAYTSKAVAIIWGILGGAIFFHEEIGVGIILGGFLIIAGVFLVVTQNE